MTAMAADIPYFDTSYLARLYLDDHGYAQARDLADTAVQITCAWHGQAEVVAALHRAFREDRLQHDAYAQALDQFTTDSKDGLFHWLPLGDPVQQRLRTFFQNASASVFLRAADALHLACAAEHGFTEVYSHDRHFLAAAAHFGVRGLDVIDPV